MNAISRPKVPDGEQSKGARFPRWAALTLNIVLAAVGHAAMPWAYSLLTTRHGWVEGHPGWWNAVGLSLVAIGLGGLLWCLGLHFARAPDTVELTYLFPSLPSAWREMMKKLRGRAADQAVPIAVTEPTPSYLVIEGPYKLSRNPMYLSVLSLWFGWVLFYGSVAVLIVWAVTWVGTALFVVPSEEDQLEARFGESFRQYKNTVRRWLGKIRR
jgi:protein-S-isoprenylcysteine O-methyltransferase Ste14